MSNPKLSANKDLGQHFLKDPHIIEKIVNDFPDDFHCLVEVGPGQMAITKDLAKIDRPFFVIEMDPRFEAHLNKLLGEDKVYIQDAMKFDWQSFINTREINSKKIWLVSNLPYNVSVPLIIQFTQIPQITKMTLMMQKEVGERILLTGQKNEMGSLKALCQNYFDCTRLCKVAPGSFNPPPKVDSVVISFERKLEPIVNLEDFKYFEVFLKLLMANRRKMLRQAIKNLVGAQKLEDWQKISTIEFTRRSETLSMEEVYLLFSQYRNIK